MAGGQGTRFWPESVNSKPKQYLKLIGEKSLLEQTLERFEGLVEVDKRFIITVEQQIKLVLENSGQIFNSQNLIIEPSGRNTAPCILLGIAQLLTSGAQDNDIVAIVPADHVILNKKGFQETLKLAIDHANINSEIVTIGIRPNFPHTGYGYIKKDSHDKNKVAKVEKFVEKPNLETAKEYVSSGEYYWNAGMFVSKLGTLLAEFERHAPEIFRYFTDLKNALKTKSHLAEIYNKIPKDSIDYAIMEKSQQVSIIEADFDWNDLGSWDALESVIEKTGGNINASSKDVIALNSQGNIIYAPGKLVSLVDINNLIIVSNEKNVLVLPKDKSQRVKEVVEILKGNQCFKDFL